MSSITNNENNYDQRYVGFYFKRTDTGEKRYIYVPVNICIANFIEFVKTKSYSEFNIDRRFRIQVVEAGQEHQNMRSEDAPAIERDFNTTIRQKYNGIYEDKSFYIRVL